MEEENETASENEEIPASVTTNKPRSKKTKKATKVKKGKDKNIIALPSCRHAWCLGEVLKRAGLEPGVCWPRPLPWALTGRLRYLPGWERECRTYKLQKLYYNVRPKKVNEDRRRFAKEAKEARLLWSFLEPALLYPRSIAYEDPEPGVVCDCKGDICKRNVEIK